MEIEDFKLKDPNPEKCNHKLTNKNTSIKIINTAMTMEYPRKFYGVCLCCGKGFKYILDETGKYKKIEEEE